MTAIREQYTTARQQRHNGLESIQERHEVLAGTLIIDAVQATTEVKRDPYR